MTRIYFQSLKKYYMLINLYHQAKVYLNHQIIKLKIYGMSSPSLKLLQLNQFLTLNIKSILMISLLQQLKGFAYIIIMDLTVNQRMGMSMILSMHTPIHLILMKQISLPLYSTKKRLI